MKHLSSKQISMMTAGLSIPEGSHIRFCPQCAAEVDRSREMLSQFGWGIRDLSHANWSGEQIAQEWAPPSPQVSHRSPVAWALAGAALAIVVAVPVYRDSRERHIKEQAEQDARLMAHVNEQLSRRTPEVLQNLMQMMNDSDDADGNSGSTGGLQ